MFIYVDIALKTIKNILRGTFYHEFDIFLLEKQKRKFILLFFFLLKLKVCL